MICVNQLNALTHPSESLFNKGRHGVARWQTIITSGTSYAKSFNRKPFFVHYPSLFQAPAVNFLTSFIETNRNLRSWVT